MTPDQIEGNRLFFATPTYSRVRGLFFKVLDSRGQTIFHINSTIKPSKNGRTPYDYGDGQSTEWTNVEYVEPEMEPMDTPE